MAYRYCPDCDKWYETSEYDVSESGETVCPVDDHAALHGYIGGGMRTIDDWLRDHRGGGSVGDTDTMRAAAERQGLFR